MLRAIFFAFQDDEFPGLIPLIERYLESTDDIDVDTSCTITQYLRLIQRRANGKLMNHYFCVVKSELIKMMLYQEKWIKVVPKLIENLRFEFTTLVVIKLMWNGYFH